MENSETKRTELPCAPQAQGFGTSLPSLALALRHCPARDQIPELNTLSAEGLIWTPSQRMQSIIVGKTPCQEPEAACSYLAGPESSKEGLLALD